MAVISNRLLPLLAAGVLLMLSFVGLRTCTGGSEYEAMLESVPQAPSPDADTPADTINTLTASVAAMTTEVQALRKDNGTIRSENRELAATLEQVKENVTARLKQELLLREKDRASMERINVDALSSLTARMDALSQSLSDPDTLPPGHAVPVGAGVASEGANSAATGHLIWTEPLDASTGGIQEMNDPNSFRERAGTVAGNVTAFANERALDADLVSSVQPVYTVPRNATLIGSTTMTALIGRVPVQGEVRDAMPFKVITGTENLAANGMTVPGVQGMVWSGTAIGDWTLSCVSGRLDSVTFVFDDGTIQTISADGQNGGAGQSLGWISDARGIPCISGERKTNAQAFLAQRIGVMAVQAASEAAATAETTTDVNESGSVTGSVTGDTGAYVLGKTVSGGSEELAKWLAERQSQSFDAVFVPAGVRVAIHVDYELPIDLHPSGRKLAHELSLAPDHHARLD